MTHISHTHHLSDSTALSQNFHTHDFNLSSTDAHLVQFLTDCSAVSLATLDAVLVAVLAAHSLTQSATLIAQLTHFSVLANDVQALVTSSAILATLPVFNIDLVAFEKRSAHADNPLPTHFNATGLLSN